MSKDLPKIPKPSTAQTPRAVKWTDEKIKALRPNEGTTETRKLLASGLYLYVRERTNGKFARQWQYRAQVDGKRRWLSLGSYPEVGLATANEELLAHQKVHQAALKGQADHPVIAAQMQRNAVKGQPTVAEAFDEWIKDKRLGSPRKGGRPVRERTIEILLESFNGDILGNIGQSKIASLTPQGIRVCIDAPRKRGSPGMAAQVYRALKGLVNFGIAQGYITGADPMRGIGNPAPYKPKTPNAANDTEIVAFFKVFAKAEVWSATKLAAELQLYTGARPGEVRLAKWSHVDLKNRIWEIPELGDKMGRGFLIHMSDGTAAIFEQALTIKTASDLVFPAQHSVDGKKCMGQGIVGQALKRLKTNSEVENFKKMIPHDLRKTHRTMMARIGIEPHIAERCLNHKQKDQMSTIYDGFEYWEQMIDAWDRAGSHLDALRSGGTLVIPIMAKQSA